MAPRVRAARHRTQAHEGLPTGRPKAGVGYDPEARACRAEPWSPLPTGRGPGGGRLKCFVALGANLGDPPRVVRDAIDALARLPDVHLAAASSLYRTAPVGLLHQPDFINAVVALDIVGAVPPPLCFLDRLFAIEAAFGRSRGVRNAPRTLDLDLLLYGVEMSNDPRCTLPHPRMGDRAFVLAPLAEIAPGLTIPGMGRVDALLACCADQRIERLPHCVPA